jgi:hypothetical protein
MNVLVTGDRKWYASNVMFFALKDLSPKWVISGGAPGADTKAMQICRHELGIEFVEVPAEWHVFKGGAGPIRNAKMLRMLEEREGDKIVLAFNDDLIGKSKGTQNMVGQALEAGISVVLYESDGSCYDVIGTCAKDMQKVWRG